MKSFTKKMFSVFAAACLCASMVPAAAMAEAGDWGADQIIQQGVLDSAKDTDVARTAVWLRAVDEGFRIATKSDDLSDPISGKDISMAVANGPAASEAAAAQYAATWEFRQVKDADGNDVTGAAGAWRPASTDGDRMELAASDGAKDPARPRFYHRPDTDGLAEGVYEYRLTVTYGDKSAQSWVEGDPSASLTIVVSTLRKMSDAAQLHWKKGEAYPPAGTLGDGNFTWRASTNRVDATDITKQGASLGSSVAKGAVLSAAQLDVTDQKDHAVDAFVRHVQGGKTALDAGWWLHMEVPADAPSAYEGSLQVTLDATEALEAALGMKIADMGADELDDLLGGLGVLWYEPRNTDVGTAFTVRDVKAGATGGGGDDLQFFVLGGHVYAAFVVTGTGADLGYFALTRALPENEQRTDVFEITSAVQQNAETGIYGGAVDPWGTENHDQGTAPHFKMEPASGDYYIDDVLITAGTGGAACSYKENDALPGAGGTRVQDIGTLDGDGFTFRPLDRASFGFSATAEGPFAIGLAAVFAKKDTADPGLTEPQDPDKPVAPDNPLVPRRINVNVQVGATLTTPDDKTFVELWSGDVQVAANKVDDLEAGKDYAYSKVPYERCRFDVAKPISLRFVSVIDGSQVDYVLVKTVDAAGNPLEERHTPDADGWVRIAKFFGDVEVQVAFCEDKGSGSGGGAGTEQQTHAVAVEQTENARVAFSGTEFVGTPGAWSAVVRDGSAVDVTATPDAGWRIAGAKVFQTVSVAGLDREILMDERTFDAAGAEAVKLSLPPVRHDTRIEFATELVKSAPVNPGGITVGGGEGGGDPAPVKPGPGGADDGKYEGEVPGGTVEVELPKKDENGDDAAESGKPPVATVEDPITITLTPDAGQVPAFPVTVTGKDENGNDVTLELGRDDFTVVTDPDTGEKKYVATLDPSNMTDENGNTLDPSKPWNVGASFVPDPNAGGEKLPVVTPGEVGPGEGGNTGNGTGSITIEGQQPGTSQITVGEDVVTVVAPHENAYGIPSRVDTITLGSGADGKVIFEVPDGEIVFGDNFDPSRFVKPVAGWTGPTQGPVGVFTWRTPAGTAIELDTRGNDGTFTVRYKGIQAEDAWLVPPIASFALVSNISVVVDGGNGTATHGGSYYWKVGDGKGDKVLVITPAAGNGVEYVKRNRTADSAQAEDVTHKLVPKYATAQVSRTVGADSAGRAVGVDGAGSVAERAAVFAAADADETPAFYEYTLDEDYLKSAPAIRVHVRFKALDGGGGNGGNGGGAGAPGVQLPGAGATYALAASVSGGRGCVVEGGVQRVAEGADFTFHFRPESSAWRVSSLSVDGGPAVPYTASSYTFADVRADHALAVGFSPAAYSGDNSQQARALRTLTSLARTGDLSAPAACALLAAACGAAGAAVLASGRAPGRRRGKGRA